jgi:hypothetical protein
MAQMLFRGSDIAENGKVKEAHQLLEEENEERYTWSEQFDIRAFNQIVIAPHVAFFPWFKDQSPLAFVAISARRRL